MGTTGAEVVGLAVGVPGARVGEAVVGDAVGGPPAFARQYPQDLGQLFPYMGQYVAFLLSELLYVSHAQGTSLLAFTNLITEAEVSSAHAMASRQLWHDAGHWNLTTGRWQYIDFLPRVFDGFFVSQSQPTTAPISSVNVSLSSLSLHTIVGDRVAASWA